MEKIEKNIDIDPKYLKMVRSILAKYLPHKTVWAYGSRVKWTATKRSDLDCVVFNANGADLCSVKEAFDESEIPIIVQILAWENIPDDFKDNIKQKYFILQNKKADANID